VARHITISSFKAQCLGLLEEVAQTGEELVVTKRGQPLARVLSAREALLPATFPGDPADRLIYATAVAHGVRLITRDERISAFDPQRTIW